MTDELLPCPFCGSEAAVADCDFGAEIECACGAIVSRDSIAEAIAAWNRRPGSPDLAAFKARVAELEKALRFYAGPQAPYDEEIETLDYADGSSRTKLIPFGERARAALRQEPTHAAVEGE